MQKSETYIENLVDPAKPEHSNAKSEIIKPRTSPPMSYFMLCARGGDVAIAFDSSHPPLMTGTYRTLSANVQDSGVAACRVPIECAAVHSGASPWCI